MRQFRLSLVLILSLVGLMLLGGCGTRSADEGSLLPDISLHFANLISGQEYQLPFTLLVRATGASRADLEVHELLSGEKIEASMVNVGVGLFAYTLGGPGVYQLRAVVKDEATEKILAATDIYTVWLLPPEVEFLSPAEGATLKGFALVKVRAVDNAGVASVKLYIDGEFHAESKIGSEGVYSFGVDTTLLPEGAHVFEAVAEDSSGNLGSDAVEVSVQNK